MEALSPFRVIGNVCGEVPVSYTMLYSQPVLMAATGRTFQLYRGAELSMLRGGPTFENDVRAVAQNGRYRFVAEGANVHAFSHHKLLWTQPHSPAGSPPTLLMSVDDFLFRVGEDKTIVVWCIRTGERLRQIVTHNNETPIVIEFAIGYTNKLLIGTAEGSIQLYNFMTGKFIFAKTVSKNGSKGNGGLFFGLVPRVLALRCSKYKDIIAYGTSTGSVIVYNYATDVEIATFNHSEASVTSVCFREDKEGYVISGTSHGEIAVWNIAERALEGIIAKTKQVRTESDVLDTPHTDAVHSLFFYPDTPLLVTAGSDNAILQFRFDTLEGQAVLVRERRGHLGACTVAHFFNGDLIATAGEDRALRITHIFSDRASWELSQGKLGRRQRDSLMAHETMKLPPVTMMASSPMRNYQWASLVSIHNTSSKLCGWRMDTRALECKVNGIATSIHTARCVSMSQCGGYALVGYTSGNLCSIHLQNQSIRHFFMDSKHERAHNGTVECVHVAMGNAIVVSCGSDARMMIWDLAQHKLLRAIALDVPATPASCLHPESSLLIVAGTDHVIRAYSVNPGNADGTPLRVFRGHHGVVTCLAVTPDTYQHVLSAASDGGVLVWDLAAGACVGAYRVPSPISSMSFHPDALFLATTHVGERGAFLWTNNLRYGFMPEVVQTPFSKATTDLPLLHYPQGRREAADEVADQGQQLEKQRSGMTREVAAAGTAGATALVLTGVTEAQRGRLEDDSSDDDVPDAAKPGQDSQLTDGLFDESKDIGLMRRRREEAERKRLDQLPIAGLKLSGVADTLWQSMTVLDQIKEKNMPLLPPKKRDVPFFIQTTTESRPTFLITLQKDQERASNAENEAKLAFNTMNIEALSEWQRLVVNGAFDEALAHLLREERPSNAAEIDLELRTIISIEEDLLNLHKQLIPTSTNNVASAGLVDPLNRRRAMNEARDGEKGYTDDEIQHFIHALAQLLRFFAHHLKEGCAIDLVQGMVGAAIKAHGVTISRLLPFRTAEQRRAGHRNELAVAMDDLVRAQQELRRSIDHLMGLPGSLVSVFSNAFS